MGFISFIGLFVKYICISLISSFNIRKTGVQLLQFRTCLSHFLNLKCLVQLLRIIIYLSSFLNYTISFSCSGSGETSTIFPTAPFTSGAAFRVSAMLAVLINMICFYCVPRCFPCNQFVKSCSTQNPLE